MIERIDRRQFIAGGLAATASLSAAVAEAYSVGSPLGFQAHALRVPITKDFPGTVQKMAAIGFKEIELVSLKGFAANTTRDGFAPLAPLAPTEIRKIIRDSGLSVSASLFKFSEFDDAVIDRTIEWAYGVGLKYMIVVDISQFATVDDWKKNFELLNRYGDHVRKAGMQMAHHTQPEDWKTFDGQMVMDMFLQNVDAKHCPIELDLESTITMGVDGAEYMLKHPGRFLGLHLRDAKIPATFGNYINALPLGQGDIDWKKMFRAAKKSGVKMYVVEMEMRGTGDPIQASRESYDYIRNLKV